MSETLMGEAARPQDPDPLKPKATRKPQALVGEAAPPRAADEKSRAAEHKREIEIKTLTHDQEMSSKTTRHKERMEWAILGVGVLICAACVGIGLAPKLSDDLKKTIIGVLALFLSSGFSFTVGRASSGK